MTMRFVDDASAMCRALELARRGIGFVEPNPPVGAVIVDENGLLLGEGYHEKCGGPHAEIHAIREASDRAKGATIYVTLEPCCHYGKTPPCTRAILKAGLKRVVVGTTDPAPHVAGGGIRELREAGIEVEVGILEDAALQLIAPFAMLFTQGRPFVHAKWAMTLDGKIASRSGHSQWISGPASRRIVHKLRGQMDAILVGAGTQRADDPQLTARPTGPRTPTRIVVDRLAKTSVSSRLVQTLEEAPVLIAATDEADAQNAAALEQAGVEVLRLPKLENSMVDVAALLRELGQKRFTNVLVEGGEKLLGSFFDAGLLDEVHVFIAPKIVSGLASPTPMRGLGLERIPASAQLTDLEIQTLENDVYIHGRILHPHIHSADSARSTETPRD